MNKQQFATLTIGIKAAYPASKILEDIPSMDFWYMMLKDIPYEVAENAVMEHVCTNVFPPNIAEIRKLCMDRCKKSVLSFDEAWGVVQKAMRNYGLREPQKAFDTMDELTLSIVKNIGWYNICNENVEANFRMSYEAKVKEAQNSNQIPAFVAQNKAILKEKYVPTIETKSVSQIEKKEKLPDPRDGLTSKQLEEREKRFKEIRRRILGE